MKPQKTNKQTNIKYDNILRLTSRDAGSESHQVRPELLEPFKPS